VGLLDLKDAAWALIQSARRGGCRHLVVVRGVMNGLLHRLELDWLWRHLSRDLPPRIAPPSLKWLALKYGFDRPPPDGPR
jgi:hypothetical protein